ERVVVVMNVVDVEQVLLVDVVIHLDDIFVGVERLSLIEYVIAARAREVRGWINIEKLDAIRVLDAGRDDSVGVHHSRIGVFGPAPGRQVREIAVEILLARNRPGGCRSGPEALEILRDEEEKLLAIPIQAEGKEQRAAQV